MADPSRRLIVFVGRGNARRTVLPAAEQAGSYAERGGVGRCRYTRGRPTVDDGADQVLCCERGDGVAGESDLFAVLDVRRVRLAAGSSVGPERMPANIVDHGRSA
jgi:hypothetical protein